MLLYYADLESALSLIITHVFDWCLSWCSIAKLYQLFTRLNHLCSLCCLDALSDLKMNKHSTVGGTVMESLTHKL